MPLQAIALRAAELRVNAAKFALHFGISGHCGELGFPSVRTSGYCDTGAMDQTLQKSELIFGRQARKLIFDFAKGGRCHS